jgi:hypothetical protein
MCCQVHGRRKEDGLVNGRREQCESGVCLERGMLGWCMEEKEYMGMKIFDASRFAKHLMKHVLLFRKKRRVTSHVSLFREISHYSEMSFAKQ